MIPRRIHVVWLGPEKPPDACINSWQLRNPGWELMIWRSETGYGEDVDEIIERAPDWAAKADVIRYWALFTYGGIAVDADSECLWPLDDAGGTFTDPDLWLCRENESFCRDMLACGYIGARPGHPFFSVLINALKTRDLSVKQPSCVLTGPYLVSEVAEKFGAAVTRLPARHFMPMHITGTPAPGNARVYGRQFWGSQRGYAAFDLADPRLVVVSTGVHVEDWVGACVRSVQRQTIAVRHVVVVDDERSAEYARTAAYGDRAALVDVRMGSDLDRIGGLHPAVANLEAAIRSLPRGSIVIWIDADDFLREDACWALQIIRDRFNADPDLQYLQGTHQLWPKHETVWPDRYFIAEQLRRGMFRQGEHYAHGLRVFRKELFERIPIERLRSDAQYVPVDVLTGLNLLELAGERQTWTPWKMLDKNMRNQPYPHELLEGVNAEDRRLRDMEPLVEVAHEPFPEIVVVSTGADCAQYAAECTTSVARQTVRCRHLVVAGDLATAEAARAGNPEAAQLVFCEDSGIPFENCDRIFRSLPDQVVISWLDLDDFLLGNKALEVIARAYAADPSLRMTWGNFRWWPSMAPGYARDFEPNIVAARAYRQASWRSTHLKTFRVGHYKRLTDAQLKRPDGQWWRVRDVATMLPMLELAEGHHQFIPEFIYGYRDYRVHIPDLRVMETEEHQQIIALPRMVP